MNALSLKEMNLAALLPKYLNDSLLCFTFIHYKTAHETPDIVTCNTNGYIYEIRSKRILQCLNLHDTAKSVGCYYLTENEKIVIFYVVFTSNNKLLILRRTSKLLKIAKTYDKVKEFQVYDFECVGFPQIKITFLEDYGNHICKFPTEAQIETECVESASSVVESLTEELQILNKHVDDLCEEYNRLRKICNFSDSPGEFGGILIGSLRFSSPFSQATEQKLKVCDKWHKVYGTYLILGMRLQNVGHGNIGDMEIVINHKGVKDYCCGFFEETDAIFDNFLFASRKICGSVKPGGRIFAVGAFQVPPFFTDSKFSVCFYVTSPSLKEFSVKETFEVDVLDVASKSTAGLEQRFTVEDLLAIMTVKSETRLKIKTEDLRDDALESMLIENLGFTRIKHLKDKLFYCTSTYLNEVFVALQHVAANPAVWIMLTYTSDSSQIYFLINALYDLLPDNTAILYDENSG